MKLVVAGDVLDVEAVEAEGNSELHSGQPGALRHVQSPAHIENPQLAIDVPDAHKTRRHVVGPT